MTASVDDSFLQRHLPPAFRRGSGLKTYIKNQKNLLVANIADMAHPSEDGYPLPPAKLRFRVHGSADRASFIQVGQRCAHDLKSALRQVDLDFSAFTDVLDFGCGCGRVLRYLYNPSDPKRFCGSDIDRESITWCQQKLPFGTFKVNGYMPPLPFGEKQFDFIYAISVFTHLDEDYQFSWLKELQRVTQPGAIIIATTHGPFTYSSLDAQAQQRLSEKGILYAVGPTGRFKIEGLPDFYQTAFHTESYIREQWGKLFRVRAYIEQGMNAHQDLIVLQKDR